MRILVAGGAGYVGSMLVPKLVARGYEVDVVDLLWFGNQLPPEVRVIQRDVLHLTQEELRGYDQVIFLAGLSNDPMAEYSPAKNFVFNAAMPAYLAYIAKRAGVKRYVYASSCSVYGYTENELYDEDSPAVSNYPYGISKLQGETAVLHLADTDFSVIALRKGTVCGWSPRMRLDLVVNTMFKTALSTGTITVNNPSIWRPILAIQDAVSAYVRAVEAPASINGVFNVASGNFTLGELADYVSAALKEFLGMEPKLHIKHITDVRNYKVSAARAATTLSFKPAHDIRSIVHELVEQRATFADFDNPLYSNISTFRQVDAAEAAHVEGVAPTYLSARTVPTLGGR
jgi:nucleoside-diphosphate-sugar epimerase